MTPKGFLAARNNECDDATQLSTNDSKLHVYKTDIHITKLLKNSILTTSMLQQRCLQTVVTMLQTVYTLA